jgi:hypothetical protein
MNKNPNQELLSDQLSDMYRTFNHMINEISHIHMDFDQSRFFLCHLKRFYHHAKDLERQQANTLWMREHEIEHCEDDKVISLHKYREKRKNNNAA